MDLGDIQVDIETDMHPTESKKRIEQAVRNLFPDAVFEKEAVRVLRATAKGIGHLKERIARQQIRDSARKVLLKGIRDGHLFFSVSKQAAFAGRVNFSRDGPLGDLIVIIRTDDPQGVVDFLSEKEVHGHHREKKATVKEKDEYLGFPED